jgi:hypothetical protein
MIILTHNGESHSIQGWALLRKIKYVTVYKRLKRGYSTEQALGFVSHVRVNIPNSKFIRWTGSSTEFPNLPNPILFRDLAKISGIKPDNLRARVRRGILDIEKLTCITSLRKPSQWGKYNPKPITVNGITHTTSEWATILGIKIGTLYEQLCYRSPEDVIGKRLANFNLGL